MSKNKLFYFVSLFSIILFLPLIYGTTIEINIAEVLDSTLKEMECCNLNNNLMNTKYDLFNSGSLAYVAKIRFDIFNGTKKVSTIWSEDYVLNPGMRTAVDLYWYNNITNNIANTLNIKAKLYRAYDILDIGNLTWVFNQTKISKETIDIENVHVYNNEIQFKVRTLNDTKKVIIYPKTSPEGWIFKQTIIDNLKSGKSKIAQINYETGIFSEKEITLIAVSDDGQSYGEKTFVLKKESNFAKWINNMMNIFHFN